MKNRIGIIKQFLFYILSVIVFLGCKNDQKKFNVLFIVIDDLRTELSCYGVEEVRSPNIDKLASRGLLFTNSYCQVPVCGASRASVMTGLKPTDERFLNAASWADKDAPGIATLPEHFKDNGYYTISNGKVFHHLTDGEGSWSEKPWHPEGQWQNYLLEKNIELQKTNRFKNANSFEAADVNDEAYFDGETADKAIKDLERLQKMDKPFFLAVGFRKPHLPFNAPQKYWDLYDSSKIQLASNPGPPKYAPKESLTNWREMRLYTDIPDEGPIDTMKAKKLIHGYYACISYIDAQVGKLINALDNHELSSETIIVLWGDHGYNLGEHGLWAKHCNYKTSLRAPLIMHVPGKITDKKTKSLVEFTDIYPTLTELCGLKLPGHLEGKSFTELFEDHETAVREAVFSKFRMGETVKTSRYSYTEYRSKEGELVSRMLYDHEKDPGENINIAELPENQNIIERLSILLKKGLKSRSLKNISHSKIEGGNQNEKK